MKKIHTVVVGGEHYEICDTHAVEKAAEALCPAFRESGSVVQCEPVVGYPLRVTSQLPEGEAAVTLTHCGKNLFDYTKYPFDRIHYLWDTGGRLASNGFCASRKLMPVGHLKGKVITLNHAPIDKAGNKPGLCFYTADIPDAEHFIEGAGGNGHTFVVPDNAEYMAFSVPNEYLDGTQIQIEVGDTVTDFEPYQERIYTKNFPEQANDWGGIPSVPGVNTLFCSSGSIQVEGTLDPIRIIDKLTLAVRALGGQI